MCDLFRVEQVTSADHAGRVTGRSERVGECGGGSPSGAVSGRDDSRLDKFGQVAHGRLDAVLDGRAGEVVTAEQEVERLVRAEAVVLRVRR